jgi:methyl-accepting chemotaxis protein
MRDILSGARGMSPVVLVVLIAWALLSVLFLTGTLLAARSIDRSVAVIKPEVVEIGDEAGFIRQAKSIADKTVTIRAAAEPLSGHLARTLTIADKGIDPKLKSILGKVGQINETAGSINTTVLQIGSTVDSIFSNASSINNHVKSIGASADSINSSTKTINASARSILSSAGAILSRVNSIDRAVATIVGQANTILDVAPAIGKDLHTVRGLVGHQNAGGTIIGHANAIDCKPILISPLAVQGLPKAFSDLLKPLLGSLTKGGAKSIACGS